MRDREEMIGAEMLGVLKLNHHRNLTLLHTTLNCTQMMCVMTCSAERGIHQETIESAQKNTQLHKTSLTQTAGMGEACFSMIRTYILLSCWRVVKGKSQLEKSAVKLICI